jgi:hypothetical protein
MKTHNLAYLFIAIFFAVWIIMKPYACKPDDTDVVRAAEAQGWSEIKIEESFNYLVSLQGCSGSDSFGYKAVGRNPVGQKVHLIICSGNTWTSKGVTVRTQ